MGPWFAAHKAEYNELFDNHTASALRQLDDRGLQQVIFDNHARGLHVWVSQWWPYRNDPNVLLLHYADLKKDTPGNLHKIAVFTGVSVPEEIWPLIEWKVSLQWMRDHEDIFKFYTVSKYYTGNMVSDEKNTFVRKGAVGDGEDHLTPEQVKRWQVLNDKFFGDKPGLAAWVKYGGLLPLVNEARLKAGGEAAPLLSKA